MSDFTVGGIAPLGEGADSPQPKPRHAGKRPQPAARGEEQAAEDEPTHDLDTTA